MHQKFSKTRVNQEMSSPFSNLTTNIRLQKDRSFINFKYLFFLYGIVWQPGMSSNVMSFHRTNLNYISEWQYRYVKNIDVWAFKRVRRQQLLEKFKTTKITVSVFLGHVIGDAMEVEESLILRLTNCFIGWKWDLCLWCY